MENYRNIEDMTEAEKHSLIHCMFRYAGMYFTVTDIVHDASNKMSNIPTDEQRTEFGILQARCSALQHELEREIIRNIGQYLLIKNDKQ